MPDDVQRPIENHFKSGRGKLVRKAGTKRPAPGELRKWRPSKHRKARKDEDK